MGSVLANIVSCDVSTHIVFHDDHIWTEGMGAKWRFVKYALWLTLRLRQQRSDIAWLPNPAQMQNPQAHVPSMMGGLGMLQPTAPPPALADRSASWLRECVRLGGIRRVDLQLQTKVEPLELVLRAAEAKALATMREAGGQRVAFFLSGPHAPMHWHGSAGAWLHDCFFRHRLARSLRAAARGVLAEGACSDAGDAGAPQTGVARPRLYPDVLMAEAKSDFLVSIHVRHFESDAWNLPPVYYESALRAVFAATPLNCSNTRIFAVGPSSSPVMRHIPSVFSCARVLARDVIEIQDEPNMDPDAEDDYDPADDVDDARRGYVFADLEVPLEAPPRH
jgi:hypothetical protein